MYLSLLFVSLFLFVIYVLKDVNFYMHCSTGGGVYIYLSSVGWLGLPVFGDMMKFTEQVHFYFLTRINNTFV